MPQGKEVLWCAGNVMVQGRPLPLLAAPRDRPRKKLAFPPAAAAHDTVTGGTGAAVAGAAGAMGGVARGAGGMPSAGLAGGAMAHAAPA